MNADLYFYRAALGNIVAAYITHGREMPFEMFEALCDNQKEARRVYEQYMEKVLELKSQVDWIRMQYDRHSLN